MPDNTTSPHIESMGSKDVLTEILRKGAQQMRATVVQNEVIDYLDQHAQQRDVDSKPLVVRNGYLPTREIWTGIGHVTFRQPRVLGKRLDELIPWLCLRDIKHIPKNLDLEVGLMKSQNSPAQRG